MKKLVTLAVFAMAAIASSVLATPKTVTLAIPGMTCEMCPITVKKALSKIDGVSKAEVSYEKKEATVTFDDGKTGVDALRKATADAGYPSDLKK